MIAGTDVGNTLTASHDKTINRKRSWV